MPNSQSSRENKIPLVDEPEKSTRQDWLKVYSDFVGKAIDLEEKETLSKIKTSTLQISIVIAFVVVLLALIAMLIHYLGPTSWHWLELGIGWKRDNWTK